MPSSQPYTFSPDGVSFTCALVRERLLYAPLCGTDGDSLKSAITPLLSGDIKLDKSRYLTRPASREDLRQPLRNLFITVAGRGAWSLARPDAATAADSTVEIGQLWHRLTRTDRSRGLEVTALTFIPVSGEKLELTRYTVRNISRERLTITPTAVVPVFARALANKHDHEHVTALLNRVEQVPEGVIVDPTMRFNEEGHKVCHDVYAVLGAEGDGTLPAGSFPTVESFLGDAGDWFEPEAITRGAAPAPLDASRRQGKEAAGALRFADIQLKPGQSHDYIVAVGIAASAAECLKAFTAFNTSRKVEAALAANRKFWEAKTGAILFDNGDRDFGAWMRWVTLQPILRRIFGCSFLPDHDYGKGGKGWRDIWQDLLSLILIEPQLVRENLLNNFAGVRIDGSNATIIGQKPGEFIADRNAITRVWMDHGVWPWLTTLLYMDQTGDDGLLLEAAPYFCDPQMWRTLAQNTAWTSSYGNCLKDRKGQVYRGTLLEHVLVQHLVPFYNVGEHNITRLESADWNDGLDMAFARGESAAFMAFYGGNLLSIAAFLERLQRGRKLKSVTVARELLLLLDTLGEPVDYDDPAAKRGRLFERYFKAVQPELSGETVELDPAAVIADLRRKGDWVLSHLRRQEMLSVEVKGERYRWFNGYYDNHGERVEGLKDGRVWMTLTGQVFALMHGVATPADAAAVHRAAAHFLRDKTLGGYRLNTNFGLRHHLALGRAFAFAYGTKENGAVFSHMAVMYAYALYRQGLAREGHEVLRSLYAMSTDGARAKIYPGIPEYFDPDGRGMYHFLTGSASWYVLTLLTMAYGVRGEAGDLVLAPQLVREEFGADGVAKVQLQFAGRRLTVSYHNPKGLDAGHYRVVSLTVSGSELVEEAGPQVTIARTRILSWPSDVELKVQLG